MSTSVQVDGLTLGVRKGKSLVQDVSFSLSGGSRTALVGESGSGKSLTVLAIAGLLPPAIEQRGGHIWMNGTSLHREAPARRRRRCGREIGVVFQEPMTALNPVLRIEAQLLEARARRAGAVCDVAWCNDALAAMQLNDPTRVRRAWPHELSGGMRQRVLVAMALAAEPGLVLADEPTTALDPLTRRTVLKRLSMEAKRGAAVLLVTHDLSSMPSWADQVVVLRAGRVCEAGPASLVLQSPVHPYTRGLLQCTPTTSCKRSLVELEAMDVGETLSQPIEGQGLPWWPGRSGYALVELADGRQVGISSEP